MPIAKRLASAAAEIIPIKRRTQTVRLASSGMIHTPSLVAWAINGFKHERDRAIMLEVMMLGFDLSEPVARALLSRSVPYAVENGETVVFVVPAS